MQSPLKITGTVKSPVDISKRGQSFDAWIAPELPLGMFVSLVS